MYMQDFIVDFEPSCLGSVACIHMSRVSANARLGVREAFAAARLEGQISDDDIDDITLFNPR